MDKGAFSIPAFCDWAGIGRSMTYKEIGAGRLRAIKAGKRTLIPVPEAQRWLDNLEPAAIGPKEKPSTSRPQAKQKASQNDETAADHPNQCRLAPALPPTPLPSPEKPPKRGSRRPKGS